MSGYTQLTQHERYQIYILMKAGHDRSGIAAKCSGGDLYRSRYTIIQAVHKKTARDVRPWPVISIPDLDMTHLSGMVSDEQFQVYTKLRDEELRWEEFSRVFPDNPESRMVLLQEVHAPAIIGSDDIESFRTIEKKSFDFVIVSSMEGPEGQGLYPLIAIEYDGIGHKKEKQQIPDKQKNEACLYANLPLLRVDYRYLPPNPLYQGKDDRAKRRQTLLSEAIWKVIFACHGYERKSNSAMNHLVQSISIQDEEDRYHALQQWDDDNYIIPWAEWDSEKRYTLSYLAKITGTEWEINLRKRDKDGYVFSTACNRDLGKTLPESPGLKFSLHVKDYVLDVDLLVEELLFGLAVFEILKYHGINMDNLDPNIPLFQINLPNKIIRSAKGRQSRH